MKRLNQELASKSFKEIYVPKATQKALIKAEIVTVIKKALEDYGIATLTGKDVGSAKSPFNIYFMMEGEQVKISFSSPLEKSWGRGNKYLYENEIAKLEKIESKLNY